MPDSSLVMRKCKVCGKEKKLIGNFRGRERKNKKIGIYIWHEFQCNTCNVAYNTTRRRNNSGDTHKKAKIYRDANKEEINKKRRHYLAENGERLRKTRRDNKKFRSPEVVLREKERSIKWSKNNREKRRLLVIANRAKRRLVKTEKISLSQINDLKSKQGEKCAICKNKLIKFHVDHIMPIAKGGTHEMHNLQLTCPRCNVRKSAKHPIDYMQELGYLL